MNNSIKNYKSAHAYGVCLDEGGCDINMSRIYSCLIKQAAFFCESYPSDILYDIEKIKTVLAGCGINKNVDRTLFVGFRDNGTSFTESALEGDYLYASCIRIEAKDGQVSVALEPYTIKGGKRNE